MKKSLIAIIATVSMALLLSAFSSADIVRDFAGLDQAFIPPLALTNAGKAGPAKKGMAILNQRWESFKSKYYESNPDDPQWKDDFDKIGRQIEQADEIVKTGKDLMGAHENLEVVRIVSLGTAASKQHRLPDRHVDRIPFRNGIHLPCRGGQRARGHGCNGNRTTDRYHRPRPWHFGKKWIRQNWIKRFSALTTSSWPN